MHYNFIANQLAQEDMEEFTVKVNNTDELLSQGGGPGDGSLKPGGAKRSDPSKEQNDPSPVAPSGKNVEHKQKQFCLDFSITVYFIQRLPDCFRFHFLSDVYFFQCHPVYTSSKGKYEITIFIPLPFSFFLTKKSEVRPIHDL